MGSKDQILKKIRAGLSQVSIPKPFPEADTDEYAFNKPEKDIVEHFAESFIALGGKFAYCSNVDELADLLIKLIDDNDWKDVVVKEPYLQKILADYNDGFFNFATELESMDAAVTTCSKAIARLGSIILSSDGGYGRSLPVYTPVHIAILFNDQVFWDLEDVLPMYQEAKNLPSQITLTTGPSRTADIEKTLVVGVHGPKEVYVFFLDQPSPF